MMAKLFSAEHRTMSCIKVQGIYYSINRAGTGVPLILLHGFTGSSHSWEPHIPYFERYFSTIAIDLPGHGETGIPTDLARYSVEQTVRDLIALFDWLLLKQVHLLGYSMGGRVALYMAMKYPERIKSLVLESASPGIADPVQRQERAAQDRQLAEMLERDGMESFVQQWENLPLFASQKRMPAPQRLRLREMRLHNSPTGLANSLRGLSTGVQPPLWEHLPRINVPTLLLAGELDSKFVEIGRQMQPCLPDAQLQIVPDAGHTTHFEQPQSFRRAVLNFLTHVETREQAAQVR